MTNPFRLVWDRFIKGKSAAWQAISAVIMAVVTIMLYRVGSDTNELSRATQKALISFAGIGAGPVLTSPDRKARVAQEFLFNWTNSGTTQARNAVTAISGDTWPSELPKGFDFPDLPGNQPQSIAIGPRDTTGVRIDIPTNKLIPTWEGKAHLYVWGWVVYDDVFRTDTHLTEFCIEVIQIAPIGPGKTGADLSDPNTPFSWNIQKCKDHNCYDDDCKDYSARIKQSRTQ